MLATKTPSRQSHGKQQSPTTKQGLSPRAMAPRPAANTPKVAQASLSGRQTRTSSGGNKQVQVTSAVDRRVTSSGTNVGMNTGRGKTSTQPAQTKRTTPWTVEAASRVASATARQGDGTVKKDSFAADVMSKAMKNEHSRKAAK